MIAYFSTKLQNQRKRNMSELSSKTAKEKFKELIQKLSAGGKVAVLIDEYDKPIVDFIDDLPRADRNRDVLKNVYGILKSFEASDNMQLVFITGVSKFSKISLFSDLNHLSDLTLNDNYSTLCGITQKEMTDNFEEHIKAAQKKYNIGREELLLQVKEWYNGYSWDAKNFVYNPFSLLSFFDSLQFGNYWFATGNTTFLIKKLHEGRTPIQAFEEKRVSATFFDKFNIRTIDFFVMLYQTGYLTIKDIQYRGMTPSYILAYPNREVRAAFLENLFEEYAARPVSAVGETIWAIEGAILDNDLDEFFRQFQSIFAGISNRLLKQYVELDEMVLWEAYYQTVIYLTLSLSGMNIECEVQTNKGYTDAVLQTDRYVYVFEFKTSTAEEALQQIHEKKYYEKHRGKGKEIFLVGVGFDTSKRNISGWKVEAILEK